MRAFLEWLGLWPSFKEPEELGYSLSHTYRWSEASEKIRPLRKP